MKKANIVFIVILVIIFILILIPSFMKRTKSVEQSDDKPNYNIEKMKIFIPKTWQEKDNYYVSKSENCKVAVGTTLSEQEELERDYIDNELAHKTITLNNIEMTYGYIETNEEKIYSYFFMNDNNYFIIFRNKINSDKECNGYLEKLKKSITLEETE